MPAVRFFLVSVLLVVMCGSMFGQSFTNPRRIATAADPKTVLAGDVNGDGVADLLYATETTAGTVVQVLLADGKGNYVPGQSLTLPTLSTQCKLADLNGDAKPDVVCVGWTPAAMVGVMLGNGDGTFQAPVVSALPSAAPTGYNNLFFAAVADLNKDGHPDVIVSSTTQIFPMLGDGSGKLTGAPVVNASIYVGSVLVADLNEDGNPDLLAEASSEDTQIFLGKGDGTFTPGAMYAGNTGGVLADLDGDGHLDLVGGGLGVLKVFHGNGDGTFATSPMATVNYTDGTTDTSGLGTYLTPLACLDLNGDGIPDVVATGYDGLTVILGEPGLKFAAPKHFPVGDEQPGAGRFQTSQQLVDMNGDGHPDVVSIGPDGLYLSYGRADGSFASADVYESGISVNALTAADFNEDGMPDVVTAGDRELYLSPGRADGTFGAATAIPYPLAPASNTGFRGYATVAHGDVNGDGHQDLIALGTSDATFGSIYVLTGHGDGSFAAPAKVADAGAFENVVAVTDVNGDGRDDIVTSTLTGVTVYLSKVNGFVAVPTTFPGSLGANSPAEISVGDLNGDGFPELVFVTNGQMAVAAGRGDGTFAAPVLYPMPALAATAGLELTATAIGDFDGDGAPDIAVLTQASASSVNLLQTNNQIVTFYRQGPIRQLDQNSFTAAVAGPVTDRSFGFLYAADLDGDGKTDLVAQGAVFLGPLNDVAVFLGQADRTLGPEADYVAGLGQGSLAIADLNHDGRPDLINANNYQANSFTVLLSEGTAVATGTLTAAPDPASVGSAFTVTAKVAVAGSAAVLNGTVNFAVDGNAIGTSTLSGGVATIAGPTTLAVGSHQLTAVSSTLSDGVNSYPAVHLSGTEVIAALPDVVSLSASPASPMQFQQTALTVSVQNGSGVPGGTAQPAGAVTITVQNIGVTVGTAQVQGGAPVALNYAFGSAGTYTVDASYAGDATHAAGTATLTVVVTDLPAAKDFTLSLNPNPVSLAAGQQQNVAINLTSLGGFSGNVALSLDAVPAGLTAQIGTSVVALSAGGGGSSTLAVSAAQTPAAMRPKAASGRGGGLLAMVALGCGLPLGCRRRRGVRLLTAMVLGVLLLGAEGCGEDRVPLVLLTPGIYQIPVTAKDAASNTTHTATLTVSVGSATSAPVGPR